MEFEFSEDGLRGSLGMTMVGCAHEVAITGSIGDPETI
jgi:hypothetical protein